jgi:hypothetical protein
MLVLNWRSCLLPDKHSKNTRKSLTMALKRIVLWYSYIEESIYHYIALGSLTSRVMLITAYSSPCADANQE